MAGEYQYDRSSTARWILSHALRYKSILVAFLLGSVLLSVLTSLIPNLIGRAFNAVLQPGDKLGPLLSVVALLAGATLLRFVMDFGKSMAAEVLGKRIERDTRDELYLSLLGKSQSFHNRQRVGDLMARMTNDVSLFSNMINPGVDIIFNALVRLIIPLVFIGLIRPELLLAPGLFLIGFLLTLRRYIQQLGPVSNQLRERFASMNVRLTEALDGVEVVKASAQEAQEQQRFNDQARRYRAAFVRHELVQARYLPPLLLSLTLAGAFLHGLLLLSRGELSVGELIAYLGQIDLLGFPTYISVSAFALVRLGFSGAARMLGVIQQEADTELHQGRHQAEMRGQIEFEQVSFGHAGRPVLRQISFQAKPGQMIAIVGQTGSGKTTLAQLVNRIYDADQGAVRIDGVDVRDWSLDSLRSQIAIIEQDTLLFSRSIADNIAFGAGRPVEQALIERAARIAQAHGFISALPDGYNTVIGERGVTLSGGQRQRLVIARALLNNPRILILDDSTSAIDSATEDEIQQALQQALQGRTTLLITHRLSQIRWADWILVLKQGAVVDQGTHDDLLGSSEAYRRIFASAPTRAG